ncbi:MAG: DNA-binding domain-containing protein [Paludibacter sp.]
MQNILKGKLTRKADLKEAGYNCIDVIMKGGLNMESIVDEMQKEGLIMDSETVLEVIKQFNIKVARKVLSGYKVDTGLVSLNPDIKGLIFNGEWNPSINKVEVSFSPGENLKNEISKTKVEIMDNDMINNKTKDTINAVRNGNNVQGSNPSLRVRDRYLHIDNDVPACGVAFRKWLCKA